MCSSDLETFNLQRWLDAFEFCGLAPLDFTRERGTEEALPWDHIHPGVRKDFLLRERRRAYEGKLSPNCRDGCAGCGLGCREAAL